MYEEKIILALIMVTSLFVGASIYTTNQDMAERKPIFMQQCESDGFNKTECAMKWKKLNSSDTPVVYTVPIGGTR